MSWPLFLFIVCLTALEVASYSLKYSVEDAEYHFSKFIQEHEKTYYDELHKQYRFEIFKQNLERVNLLIEEHNFTMFGITKFMDLTPEEFENQYLGGVRLPEADEELVLHGCSTVTDSQIPDANAPETLDWRQQGIVTRVKNQQSCGGCYAFSASGNIEGQYARKYGSLVEFSEQQTIDCDSGSNGCGGGFMSSAFTSMIQMGGIETETAYPFVNTQQRCSFSASQAAARVTSCTSYNLASQEKLKQLLYSVGPISVAVRATNFNYYTGGVMLDSVCNVGGVNHAVLLVGYGTENGMPYWLLKNSWATSFGEEGYIKIQRGEGVASCGMMNSLMASAELA